MWESDLNVFMCPKTRQPLRIDWENQTVTSAQGDVSYPILDGVIDFVGHDTHVVRMSYDKLAGAYNYFFTNATVLTNLYNTLVWGLQDADYVTPLLRHFPPVHGGEIVVDIPVGTGVFTVDLYTHICQRATIMVMDYSWGMLQQAKTCYETHGINNIIYACADVGSLPIADGRADVLLTMNGYHAFPDKHRALTEFARIMKPGAALSGCFYVKNERWFTDFFIKHVYTRQGTFTPPFLTMAEVKADWGQYFEFNTLQHVKSIAWLAGVKK